MNRCILGLMQEAWCEGPARTGFDKQPLQPIGSRLMIVYSKTGWMLMVFTMVGLRTELPTAASQSAESSAPTASESADMEGYELVFPAMGTRVTLKAFSDDPQRVQQAFERGRTLVEELEQVLTDYDPQSETRQLTQRAYGAPHPLSDPLWEVLQTSQRWYRWSNGAFDPSIGAVTRLYRKYRRIGELPPSDQLADALESSGWEHVQLNSDQQTVELSPSGVAFDFGAVGKGYIVDRVFESLENSDLEHVLVDISGNMRCGKAPPGKEAWNIGLAPLDQDRQDLRLIPLKNAAIATSGDLWQFVDVDGKRFSHIIDPRSGRSVPGPVSASVIASDATTADVLATICCVVSEARALELIDQLKRCELLLVRQTPADEQEVVRSEGFPRQRTTEP